MGDIVDVLRSALGHLNQMDGLGAVSAFLLGAVMLVSGWFKDAIKEYLKGPIQNLVSEAFGRHRAFLLGFACSMLILLMLRGDFRLYASIPIILGLAVYLGTHLRRDSAADGGIDSSSRFSRSHLFGAWLAPVLLLPFYFYDQSTRLPDPNILYLLPPAYVAPGSSIEVIDPDPMRRQIYSIIRAGMTEAWPASSPYKFGSRRANEAILPYIDEEQTPHILDQTLKAVEAEPPVQYVAFPRIKRAPSALVLFGTTFARKNGVFVQDRTLDVEVPDDWQKVAAVMVGFVFAQAALPTTTEQKAEETLAKIFDNKLTTETTELFKGRPPANDPERCIVKHFAAPRNTCISLDCVNNRIVELQHLLALIPNARDDQIRKVITTGGLDLGEPTPFVCDHGPA